MMLDPVRIYATSIYIASMIIALFCALYVSQHVIVFSSFYLITKRILSFTSLLSRYFALNRSITSY